MARPLRINYEGAVYHITARGNERKEIFKQNSDRTLFLEILANTIKRYQWICHAYCLMNNHYHLLIETPQANISSGMRHLNSIYSQYFNRTNNRIGHLFQGRFKGILVQKDSHLLELCRYVVLNPVRANICKRPEEYIWSSYRATIGLEKKLDFLETDWILSQFRMDRKRYHDYVNDRIISNPWERLNGQIYFGSQEFAEKTVNGKIIPEIPRIQQFPIKPPLKELIYKKNGILSAYYFYKYTMKEIAESLNVHYSSVGRYLKNQERNFNSSK